MQQCLGPCGREVEQVNSAGLCAKCQQARASEPKEGLVCKHGCGLPPHRGRCKKVETELLPKRKYTRRTTPVKPETDSLAIITQLRTQYQDEYDKAEHALAVLKVKLEAADEFIKALK